MPNSEGQRLTTPLKYDVIGDWQCSAATAMQLTHQNRFTKISNGYKMTNGSRVRKLDTESEIQMPWLWGREQWVNRNLQSRWGASRLVNGEWFNQKQHHVWCFGSPFHVYSPLVIWKWSSFALSLAGQTLPWESGLWIVRTTFTCLLHLMKYFAAPTSNFCSIRAVCFVSRV